MDVTILNTGGTFNKRYDPIEGRLYVPRDDKAVEAAVASMDGVRIEGLIYKDSLRMDESDRAALCAATKAAPTPYVVIVHGTDTMDRSAAALAAAGIDKRVVLTGAMVPFFIDPVEATANLALALGAVRLLKEGVYIAMHGRVLPFDRIRKNRKIGRFEAVTP